MKQHCIFRTIEFGSLNIYIALAQICAYLRGELIRHTSFSLVKSEVDLDLHKRLALVRSSPCEAYQLLDIREFTFHLISIAEAYFEESNLLCT